MKPFPHVPKIDSITLTVAFSLAAACSAKPDWCETIGFSTPAVVVVENQPFARIRLYRSIDTNLLQTVDYRTWGGNPGVDYVPFSGTATFAVGQEATDVDISLIDNGMLDGFRDFEIVLTNGSPGLLLTSDASPWVRIEDNEIRSAVDPLFVPDRGAGQFYGYNYKYVAAAMPDGRILLPGSQELTMLHSDGRLDPGFATKLTDQFTSLRDVQVLSDGRILVAGHDDSVWPLDPAPRLVRLLPSGDLDSIFTISNFTGTAIGQPDGKVLAISTNASNKTTLRRFNTDGSPDAGFGLSAFADASDALALQRDGRILVGKYDYRPGSVLIRLNSDGSPDDSFASALMDGKVDSLLVRANGMLIVTGDFTVDGADRRPIAQLYEDGRLDATFKPDLALLALSGGFRWSTTLLEQADGGLVTAETGILGYGAVMQWNADGTLARELASLKGLRGSCSYSGVTIALTQDGQILVGGNIFSVDGFPRRGLARLHTSPPERDFRVVTLAEFHSSNGVARIRVARTGSTTNPAFVSFTTRDDTARAGEDYVAQTGRLDFAPFEVSKEVTVPLLARIGVDARRRFNLELRNPSAGYTNIPLTPIAILSDLRIATDSLQPRGDGSISMTLYGTVPGRWYSLESSTDLKNWQWVVSNAATGSALTFDSFIQKTSPQFFRTRSE